MFTFWCCVFSSLQLQDPGLLFWPHIKYPQGIFPFPFEYPFAENESCTPFHFDWDGHLSRDQQVTLIFFYAFSESVGLNWNPRLRAYIIKC